MPNCQQLDRPRRLTLLLSEGSSLSARQTIYSLGRRHVIDLVDPNRFCQNRFSRLVRRRFRCPHSAREPAAYLQFLVHLLRRGRYDVLLATHEQVYLLSRFRDRLSRLVGLAVPSFESLRPLASKVGLIQVLDAVGLRQPSTMVVRTPQQLRSVPWLPCYVKAAQSTAGTGVWLVRSRPQLGHLADKLTAAGLFEGQQAAVVQQPAPGVLAGAHAVFQYGRLVAAHCYEVPRTGVGRSAQVRQSGSHPEVVGDLERLGRHLDWHGAMHVEYGYDPVARRAYYIEVNPRITQTFNATLSGLNLCELLVHVSLDEQVPRAGPSRPGVRSHAVLNAMLGAAQRGRGRCGVLAELFAACCRLGPYRNSQDEITRLGDDPLSLVPAAAVLLRLMADPSSASRIVGQAVSSYAVPAEALQRIEALPDDLPSHGRPHSSQVS